ncbi:phenylalanine--tRNA ligase subunit beta [Devriesea agamarum]|uniref:phenylalanine--tRNA ligase subunit beta n=1 Tax=Devriesea agamarum TaxID=472569 RepID=UPI00071C52B1|nr:phenylalanine--tRNA ligase subunit beta [Devriesea agamarum]
MPRIPLTWLADHVRLGEGARGSGQATAEAVAADLVSVGLEEEAIYGAQVTGPLVIGQVLDLVKEPQKNGKTINWCRVDVGPDHNHEHDNPKDPQPGDERPSRGIICGAHNFVPGDFVVVSLPGTVLPGPFPIAARKTYGHISDGMICSTAELGLGEDPEDGIIVLGRGIAEGMTAKPGDDAIALFGLGEEVVEINVTPDRGYCFSMRGVAREYSHATGAEFSDPVLSIDVPPAAGDSVPVELADEAPIREQDGCSQYIAQLVTGVNAKAPSPRWMQQRLTLAGMRPISLIVDVANYVMLDLGQPLHTFDAARLSAPIVVRRARVGEVLTTLDNVRRTLHPEDLVICDSEGGHGERVLAIAGVMGGASTEVTDETTDVLIEAATFSSFSIARSARRHKLPSEASKRFERGVDPALAEVAAIRAAQLIAEYGGGTVDATRTVVGSQRQPEPIDLDMKAAANLVGVEYSREEIVDSLRMLGCHIQAAPAADAPNDAGPGAEVSNHDSGSDQLHQIDVLRVTPPTWRPDLKHREDLIEEIARLNGYDRIPSVLPKAPAGGRGLTLAQRRRRTVALTLAEKGLTEVLSYPFTGEATFEALGYAEDDRRRDTVRLANPISEADGSMRTELLQTLLPVARLNIGRGADDVALFEIGLVSAPSSAGPVPSLEVAQRPSDEQLAQLAAAVPAQPRHLAAVIGGPTGKSSWYGPARVADWSDAVDAARRVLDSIGVVYDVVQTERAPWHPGRCAELRAQDGTVLGYAGELHPRVAKAFGLPHRTSACELSLDAAFAAAPDLVPAEPLSTYPVAKEDFAFVVDQTMPASAIEAAITAGIGDVLESVRLFDVYVGEQVGEGKKSLAFAVRLRSAEGTLTADQIGAARERCIRAVQAIGGVLRA